MTSRPQDAFTHPDHIPLLFPDSLTFSDAQMHTARLRPRARQFGSPLLLIAPPASVFPARFAGKDFVSLQVTETGAMI